MPQLTPAITQATPPAVVDRRQNELAFYLDTTEAVLDPRVERGDLLEAHAGVVRWVIIEVRRLVVDSFLPWAKTMFENLTPKGRAPALAKETAKARAELDGLDGPASPVAKLENDAALLRSNAWPRRADGYTIIADKPAPFDPLEREIRDEVKDDKPPVVRRLALERLKAGDSRTFAALWNGTPVRREEIFDPPTMRKAGDICLDRAGKRQEVESAEMAVSLATYVLGQARAAVDAIAGAEPTDYVTGSGRRVTRASERATESAPADFASRLLRLDAQGNSVRVREIDGAGNAVPVTPTDE